MGTAPDAVKRLVDHFDQNRDAYLSGSYNEEQLVDDAYRYRPSASGLVGTQAGFCLKGRRP